MIDYRPKLSTTIHVRLTVEDFARLADDALRKGVSYSAEARNILRAHFHLADAHKKRPRTRGCIGKAKR